MNYNVFHAIKGAIGVIAFSILILSYIIHEL